MPQLKELLVEQLQDLLHAEGQLTGALPKMAQAAHHPKLKEAFEKHLVQTEGHVERLRQVFEMLGEAAEPKPCKAMMGLIEEGKETIGEGGDKEPIAADLALIAAAQRVEHYEIASYGCLHEWAGLLGYEKAASLLKEILDQEKGADETLTEVARSGDNEEALDVMPTEGINKSRNGQKASPGRSANKSSHAAVGKNR